MNTGALTAAELGLANCRHCQLLLRLEPQHTRRAAHCPRCGAAVHLRIPHSVQRTWALLITAALCYLPANTLPILTVVHFGRGAPDTIMSGVIHLIDADQWPIALLVFAASVVVPLLKIATLAFLLISVSAKSRWRPRDRVHLYHIVDVLGRWSMIDIFMISILVALVQLGSVATVLPGLGAAFFGAVVVATMLAALTFDPRLIWDAARS